MPSLLENDELRTFLEGIDYPIDGANVLASYELTEHIGFPRVIFSELYNNPINIECAEHGIKEGPVDVTYEIAVMCRDCVTTDNRVIDRDQACREMTKAIRYAMLKKYGMVIDDQSPNFAYDSTCNVMTSRYVGVIDNYDYTYSR